MPIYAIEQHIPVIHPSSFVHPSAEIIGDVIIEAQCYVGPNAVLRGDFGRIHVQSFSNVQDNCVLHSFPGGDCLLKPYSHVGHGAILHGCTLEPNCLIGMNTVIMDNSVIGSDSIVAAQSFIKANSEFPPRALIMGTPASQIRKVSDSECDWKQAGTAEYIKLANRCQTSLREIDPLTEIEADRPRFTESDHRTKKTSDQ